MATIQVRNVPDDVHEKLRRRALGGGQSLQQYMLEVVCREAELVSLEELLARKRVEALAYGETSLGMDVIVEAIRAHRDAE